MSIKVRVKINEIINKYRLSSISELSNVTGIRRATLSELASGKRESIAFVHLERISISLNIKDIREIIDFNDI